MGWVLRCGRVLRPVGAPLIAFALGSALLIAPATIRNLLKAGEFVLISSNAGINLYMGNNQRAEGFGNPYIEDLGFLTTCYDYPNLVERLSHKLGQPLSYRRASSYFAGKAKQFMQEHPRDFMNLTLKKMLLFWGSMEVGHNKELHYQRIFSSVLNYLPGRFSWVLTLGALGFFIYCMDFRRRKEPGRGHPADRGGRALLFLVLLYIISHFLSVLPFFAEGRYRVPIIPSHLVFDRKRVLCGDVNKLVGL